MASAWRAAWHQRRRRTRINISAGENLKSIAQRVVDGHENMVDALVLSFCARAAGFNLNGATAATISAACRPAIPAEKRRCGLHIMRCDAGVSHIALRDNAWWAVGAGDIAGMNRIL